jgi:hypothetical protein
MLSYVLPLLGLLMLPSVESQAVAATGAPAAGARTVDAGQPPGRSGSGQMPVAARSDTQVRDAPAAASGAAPPPAVTASGPAVVDAATVKAATLVATAYLNALNERGIAAAPAYLHPAAMARFKALVMPGLKDEQMRGHRNLLNATFGRDAGYPSAAAADPTEFLTRFARLIAVREPDAVPRFTRLTPIGLVREGEQLHVLVRLGFGGPGLVGSITSVDVPTDERIEVVSLLPQGKDWKVLLDGRLQELGRSLGGRRRAEERRGALPLEPLPEGQPPAPVEPQGPAGLPPLPGPTR